MGMMKMKKITVILAIILAYGLHVIFSNAIIPLDSDDETTDLHFETYNIHDELKKIQTHEIWFDSGNESVNNSFEDLNVFNSFPHYINQSFEEPLDVQDESSGLPAQNLSNFVYVQEYYNNSRPKRSPDYLVQYTYFNSIILPSTFNSTKGLSPHNLISANDSRNRSHNHSVFFESVPGLGPRDLIPSYEQKNGVKNSTATIQDSNEESDIQQETDEGINQDDISAHNDLRFMQRL